MRKDGILRSPLFLLFCAGLLSLLVASAMAAARRGRGYDQTGMAQRPEDIRRQELEQQAQQAASLVETALNDFFTQVNEYKDPEELYVKSAAVLLEENRRYMMSFDDPQKARYMLLQGWVDYCAGDLDQASASSARACRTDGTNRDAWISQQYFSVLGGKRPLQPRPPRPQALRRGDMMGTDMAMEYGMGQSLYGTQGKLEFNPETLRQDLLGKELKPFTTAFLDGKAMEYQHNKEVLCLLMWEIPEEDLKEKPQTESGEQLLYTRPGQTQPMQTGTVYEETGYAQPTGTGVGIDQQTAALELLQKQAADSPEIRFFTVLTNKADQKEATVKYLAEHPTPLPVMYAFGAVADLVLDAKVPFVLVVDKAGQFRFAGSAEGFLLPMLLGRLTGIKFTKQTSQAAGGAESLMDIQMYDEIMNIRSPLMPLQGDPNRPAAARDPNSPARSPRGQEEPASRRMMQDLKDRSTDPISRVPTQDLTAEEVCGAAQLQAARDFFMKAAGRKFITYRKGIDLCRYVIKNCPNSENAKAARDLLRTEIPEDQRDKYGLTNEELGL